MVWPKTIGCGRMRDKNWREAFTDRNKFRAKESEGPPWVEATEALSHSNENGSQARCLVLRLL